jgi:hypothetical protein
LRYERETEREDCAMRERDRERGLRYERETERDDCALRERKRETIAL